MGKQTITRSTVDGDVKGPDSLNAEQNIADSKIRGSAELVGGSDLELKNFGKASGKWAVLALAIIGTAGIIVSLLRG